MEPSGIVFDQDLKELVKHEIETVFRAREDVLWTKGQLALHQLEAANAGNDKILLEKMGALQVNFVAISRTQEDLANMLKELTSRTCSMLGDVPEITSTASGKSSYDPAQTQVRYSAGNALYPIAAGQASPQTAPTVSQGTAPDTSLGTDADYSRVTKPPPPPGLGIDSPTSQTDPLERKDSTTILLSEVLTEQAAAWEQWRKSSKMSEQDMQLWYEANMWNSTSQHTQADTDAWSRHDDESWAKRTSLDENHGWQQLSVCLYKTVEAPTLGTDINAHDDGTLSIETVLPGGLVWKYNEKQTYPEARIAVGDRICLVNGFSDPVTMRDECKSRMKLEIIFLHRRNSGSRLRADAKSFHPHA
eukprot:GEMP01048726.1.p1 GENE.GEMP01048726.1~~GEMP01048726.1.p1  ORF type:complete len:399 (+),score=84.18 GEMP01048726.1:117-1199(+)